MYPRVCGFGSMLKVLYCDRPTSYSYLNYWHFQVNEKIHKVHPLRCSHDYFFFLLPFNHYQFLFVYLRDAFSACLQKHSAYSVFYCLHFNYINEIPYNGVMLCNVQCAYARNRVQLIKAIQLTYENIYTYFVRMEGVVREREKNNETCWRFTKIPYPMEKKEKKYALYRYKRTNNERICDLIH